MTDPKDIKEAVAEVADEGPIDEIEELKKQLESANKRISDTAAAFTAGQERIKALEAEQRLRNRPPLLSETDGLEEAIKYVTEGAGVRSNEAQWIDAVSRAVPDVDELMKDAEFSKTVTEERDRRGESWKDPLTAISVLSHAKTELAARRAVERYHREHIKAESKASVMDIPGGANNRGSREAPVDEVAKIRGMSNEEFIRMRNGVLGYNA
ncbi:MAG: hypothetical protein MN733_09945 [Nitrososphaera sp.]|nr:hypothetical protein [Nitrososphaera sp.]